MIPSAKVKDYYVVFYNEDIPCVIEYVLDYGLEVSDFELQFVLLCGSHIDICYTTTPNRRLYEHGSGQTIVVLLHNIDICTTTVLMGIWV